MIIRFIFLMLLSTAASAGSDSHNEGGFLLASLNKSGRHSGHAVEVHLGETVSAPIALGQINRIVLPFEHPEIRTLNPSTAEIQGHVLYIAPVDPAKVYLYVTNADDPDAAMSLSLEPKDIPPQEMTLELANAPPAQEPRTRAPRSEAAAPSSEEEDPTRMLLRSLAMGQIPEGYRFRHPESGETIHCRQKHLLIQTRQVFTGHGAQIRVGVLRNNGKSPLLLDEESCIGTTPVQAIATYPSGPLPPGHEAEIYVVMAADDPVQGRSRPRLLSQKS